MDEVQHIMDGPSGADAAAGLTEALGALLPAGLALALAWADGSGEPMQAAVGSPGTQLRDWARRMVRGEAAATAAGLDLLWEDGPVRVAVALDPAVAVAPGVAARWHRLAPELIGTYVRAERAAGQVRALRKSERGALPGPGKDRKSVV